MPALARALLGTLLRHDDVVLRVTEVEAYAGPEDSASHARSGPTARNAPMWGPPGVAYVYLVYGIHRLLNVTAAPPDGVGAVLIRAAEPVAGLDTIRARRGGRTGPEALAGPGRLSQALGVELAHSGTSLLAPGGLELRRGSPPARVRVGPRVGIDYALPQHRRVPWRFADADSRCVSHPRHLRDASSP